MTRFEELEIADHLPSPPGLCLALLDLAHERRDARGMIVDCLRADPASTGRLLARANASRAQGEAPVASARAAASRLDPLAIREVAMGFSLPSKRRDEACEGFDLRAHWLGSLACAAAAESIARRFGILEPDDAFTLGLLARVGMLAMATVHPKEFAGILREGGAIESAELRVLGIDHWQAAAGMMEAWGLPASFRTAVLALSRISSSAAPVEPPVASPHALLALALRMADAIVAGEADMTQVELRAAREEAERQFHELAELCGLRAPSPGDAGASQVAAERPEDRTEPAARPATRILVVDDDPSARHLLDRHLRRAGYEVVCAADGRAGLAAAISDAPEMVITDWLMPGLSGLELCEALRKTEAGRRMYLILLTSREEEDSVVEGLEAGANDYLTKPFNSRILLARVQAGARVIELQRQVEADKLLDRKRVAVMARLTRKLRTFAEMDTLTGLHNRRHAMISLQDAWNASGRHGRALSVVMVDIDHFKRVNDEHGHQTGDAVLRSTAEVLRSTCRRTDVVCRLGGEEFLVIHSSGALNEALACAERLRAAVEANAIDSGSFHGHVTISLGAAERTPEMQGIDDLIAAADRAVYEAKSRGRNQVRIDPPRRELRDSA